MRKGENMIITSKDNETIKHIKKLKEKKYREEYGPFQSIEDITNISGIKEGVYNNIKEYIIVD